MLVVKIEHWESGDPTKKTFLGTMIISSKEKTEEFSSYIVTLYKYWVTEKDIINSMSKPIINSGAVWRKGFIGNFCTTRNRPWLLVYLSLKSVFTRRNQDKSRS